MRASWHPPSERGGLFSRTVRAYSESLDARHDLTPVQKWDLATAFAEKTLERLGRMTPSAPQMVVL